METKYQKQVKKIFSKTKSSMKKAGTYIPEFDVSIQRYADLRLQYDLLQEQWYQGGCEITEEYTNKSGATNRRKTALYLAMETLRKELLEMETTFGLTPKGLKQIRAKGLEGRKDSVLGAALRSLDE